MILNQSAAENQNKDNASPLPAEVKQALTSDTSNRAKRPKRGRTTRRSTPPSVAVQFVQARAKELFWLHGQDLSKVRTTVQKECEEYDCGMEERDIGELVRGTLYDEVNAGQPDGNGNRYVMRNGGLFKVGDSPIQLSHFSVPSITTIIRDDGIQRSESFRLEVLFDKHTESIELSADDFRQMNWHLGMFHAKATINPRMKEEVLVAIQRTASRKQNEVVYTHTGWRQFENKLYFLHADGAIGANGNRTDIKASLKENLRFYSLPDPPSEEILKRRIRQSLDLLEVAEDSVSIPLVAAIWRAPVGDPDFTVHLSGLTGSLKSALATLAQQHFGRDFDDRHLPAYWSSTSNFIQESLHAVKDVISVLDDFVPRGTDTDKRRQHADFDRIVRAAADNAGRGRLDSHNTDSTAPHGPRGLLLSTGEVVPEGQSCQSRLINIPLSPRSVRIEKLSECQLLAQEGAYAETMSGYLQWLAQNHSTLKEISSNSQSRIKEFRLAASRSNNGGHLRTPENIANLALGVELLLQFALEKGAITEPEFLQLWNRCWNALTRVGIVQSARQQDDDPMTETLRLLKNAERDGRIKFRKLNEDTGRAEHRDDPLDTSDVDLPNVIGWRMDADSEWLCDPDLLWAKISELYATQKRSVPKGKNDLFMDMMNRGLIQKGNEAGRPTVKRPINGERKRVIVIPLKSFSDAAGANNDKSTEPSSGTTDIPIPRTRGANRG